MALAALPDERMLVMGGETHLNTSRDQVGQPVNHAPQHSGWLCVWASCVPVHKPLRPEPALPKMAQS